MLLKCGRLSAKWENGGLRCWGRLLGDGNVKVYMEYIYMHIYKIGFNEVWCIMREVFYQLKGQLTDWAGAYIDFFY